MASIGLEMDSRRDELTQHEPADSPNWPTLLGRAVDDVSRIVQAEIHLFEAHLSAFVETAIKNALAMLIVLSMFVVGGTCFVGAAIVLLHRWLQEWWIAFALAGGVFLAVAIGLWLALAPPAKDNLQSGSEQ
jgi:putative superfamily III holin-X